jgi:hypothetical protein
MPDLTLVRVRDLDTGYVRTITRAAFSAGGNYEELDENDQPLVEAASSTPPPSGGEPPVDPNASGVPPVEIPSN